MGFPGVVTLPAAAAAVVARLTAAAAVVVPLAAVELCTARVPSKLRGKVSRLCSGWHTQKQCSWLSQIEDLEVQLMLYHGCHNV